MEYVEAEGSWGAAPETTKSGLPISDEQYMLNVRDNCLLDLPNLEVQKEHDLIMVMVCGGPSAKDFLEEIREKSLDDRYRIVCSNQTHDWLIDNGIIPHYDFIIDPKPNKVDDVKNPHPGVEYLIGISCDPAVFEALEGYNVKRVFSVSGVGNPSDMHIIRALFPTTEITYLVGGTMAGLRAMALADIMGFTKCEYYGFDSCYFETDENGDPIYYSYDKKRKENIQEAQTDDGRIFLTSPVFASQANQYLKWKHRFEWIDFTIFGDSLTAAIHEIDEERCRPKHDLVITDYARTMNQELHEKENDPDSAETPFGVSGSLYAGQVAVLAGQLLKTMENGNLLHILDYGCGKCTLREALPPITGVGMRHYDPAIEGLDLFPEPADLVVCTDVLEHVEPECLENVLDHLKHLTKKILFVSIATVRAHKSYSDGQNCHLIVENADFWLPKLKKRFFVVEKEIGPDHLVCVLQAKEVL